MLKPAPYAMPIEKAMFYAGWAFTAIVLLFLIAPILAVMPLSFNAEPYFSYPMPGLSLQWYRDFFGNERWWGSLVLSVKLAVTVTILSTMLGTMAALGLARTHLPLRPIILGTLVAAHNRASNNRRSRDLHVLWPFRSDWNFYGIGPGPYGPCHAVCCDYRHVNPDKF